MFSREFVRVFVTIAVSVVLVRYRPDVGLLTSNPAKHDVGSNPHIIAPDPFSSDDCLDVFPPDHHFLLTTVEDEYTMSTGEDEPSSGLNGRLRPRKSAPSPQSNNNLLNSESKTAQDRPKRMLTSSKASTVKPDNIANKSDLTTTLQLLCPYCDRKFVSKQAVSEHVRRIHFSSSKQDYLFECLFCKQSVSESHEIIRHMVDSHPNQYFACLDCHARFPSTTEFAEHKLNVCENPKMPYRSKLRQKASLGSKKNQKSINVDDKDYRNDNKEYTDGHRFNGIVISCELKPSEVTDNADIEDNITTNLILPPSKSLGTNAEIEKNAVILLDDIQWSKRMPTNFSFHNTDADQILSRLGVVHRSPRTGESTKKDWFKNIDESTQKFEKCFDTGFYSKVASNVQENLSKFLDGSFNFNPDADNTIKTRKLKNSVVINTAEGFPILLACEQFNRITFDGYMPRTIAPKHKWKWDNEKNLINPDDLKRDSHVNNCIITLVSSLDIWTQLCMRRKFEEKFSIAPLEKKTEKQNKVSKELKEILESRVIPSTSSHIVKNTSKPMPSGHSLDFPESLGLRPTAPTYDVQPAVLSGEWVRPRCYVCCACGAQTRDSRGLSSHITTHHPNAQVQHYEIVGELLLNADILKHLYVPPSLLNNRTRPLRGFRECTKCKKSITLEDLHQHMLDCAGDTPTVRRKCRYRPFGVRRRRPRLPDNTIRKKIRKDIRRQTRQTRMKSHIRQRPKIRSEVGDAETIRKMIADLPAKRHRAMVTPTNPILRPRKKLDQQRNKLIMKRRPMDIKKNYKRRESNRNSNNRQSESPNDEDDDNKSNKSNKDDDDNQPLKQKIKRLLPKSTRQNELLKRKVAMNRAKRRAQNTDQTPVSDNIEQQPEETEASGGGAEKEQLPFGAPQRIDINNSPYNTRENSNRNRSHSNDQQRPGCSGQDGNINNGFIPVQNAPLKHSIARLTAEKDLQDQALQYHHMFLLEQECLNLNQHVPSDRQTLFENEAVVTKLDKPPLYFQPPEMLDPFAFQRNKLNKPRKGLNDCIAMLKNKLVDPIPSAQSYHVGCSIDNPFMYEMPTTNQIHPNAQYEMSTRPAEVFSRHHFIHDQFFELHNESNIIHQRFPEIPLHFIPTQKLFELPHPSNKTKKVKPPKQKQNMGQKRESTRRRSTRTEKDILYKTFALPPHIEIIPQIPIENYPVKVSPPSKVNSVHCQNEINNSNYTNRRRKPRESYDQSAVPKKQTHVRHDNKVTHRAKSLKTQHQRAMNENYLLEIKQAEAYTQSQLKQAESYTKSQLNQIKSYAQSQKPVSTYTQSQLKQAEAYVQSQQKQAAAYVLSQQKQAEAYAQAQLKQAEIYAQSQQKQTEIYTQLQQIQAEVYSQSSQKHTEAYIQPPLSTENSFDINVLKSFPKHDVSRVLTHEIYPENDFNNLCKRIPLIQTHFKMGNLERILPAPLDLSVNITGNSDTSTKRSNSHGLSGYGGYGSLALTHRSTDDIIEDLIVDDTAESLVDLRGRSTPSAEVFNKNVEEENTTDFDIEIHEMDSFPTDLSVRKKNDKFEYGQIDESYDCAQGCSRYSKSTEDKPIDIVAVVDNKTNKGNTTDIPVMKLKEIFPTLSCNIQSNAAIVMADVNNIDPAEYSEGIDLETYRNQQLINTQEENSVTTENDEPEIDVEKSQDDYDLSEAQSYIKKRQNIMTYGHYEAKDSQFYANKNHQQAFDTSVVASSLPLDRHTDLITTGTTITDVSLNQSLNIDNNFTNIEFSSKLQAVSACNKKIETPVPCSSANAVSLYNLANPLPTSHSKYENTTPVYTLANACISMSKIEPSSIIPVTSSITIIPETTIARVASVYTFTKTETSVNSTEHVPITESCSQNNRKDQESALHCSEANIGAKSSLSRNILKNDSPIISNKCQTPEKSKLAEEVEIDPETAKKIAMLPKELREILGTMPVNHRNQLLNVLPQYVSKSITMTDSFTEPQKSSVVPVTISNSPSTLTSRSTVATGPASQEHLHDDDLKPLACFQAINEPATDKNDHIISMPLFPKIDENRIIDLTDDDAPLESKANKVTEDNNAIISIEQPVTITNKPKPNDQTASLRAVRIKAPSERNKSICLENQVTKTNTEQKIKTNIQVVPNLPDNIDKISEPDITMAIQQAAESSSQHNKLRSGEYPITISPASTECSSDETTKNILQKIKMPVLNISVQKVKDAIYNIPLPKTGKALSTISKKERNGFHVEYPEKILDKAYQEPAMASTSLMQLTKTESSISTESELKVASEPLKLPSKPELSSLEKEDSEDDISLATIVKQKQQHKKDKQKVIIAHKKKRNKICKKKSKKITLKTSNTNPLDKIIDLQPTEIYLSSVNNLNKSLNNDQNKNISQKKEVVIDTPCKNTITVCEFDKNFKKNIKERYLCQNVLENTYNDGNMQKNIIDKTECGKTKTYTVDKTATDIEEINSNDNLHKYNKNTYATSDIRNEKANGNNVVSDAAVMLARMDDRVHNSDSIDALKKGKNKSMEKEKHDINVCVNEVHSVNYLTNQPEEKSITKEKLALEITLADKDVDKEYDNDTTSILHHVPHDICNVEDITDVGNLKNEKQHNRSTSFKNIETSSTSQDLAIQDFDPNDNNVTPLRRSRRGKSLYVESSALEKEVMNFSEVIIEYKTPLTKKHRIFSKLLQDEGKPDQPAHSTPEKCDRSTTNIFSESEEVIVSNINVKSDINDTVCVNEVVEKNKATKRSISPTSIMKSKKMKSIEYFERNTFDYLENDTQTIHATLEDSTPQSSNKNTENNFLPSDQNSQNITKVKESLGVDISVKNVLDITFDNDQKSSGHVIDNQSNSTEKRKIDNQISFDLNPSSKPKKCKRILDDHDGENLVDKSMQMKSDLKVDDAIATPSSEPRTACYNLPIPARRGRSKSVVVKSSSNDLYDPYDIDLEDMIEQHELFRRKKKTLDQKFGNSYIKGKTITPTTIEISKVPTEKANADNNEIVTNTDKSAISDSDESSKSDVPLQKYVEEKEKKSQLEISSAPKKITIDKVSDGHGDETTDVKKPESTFGNKITVAKNEAEINLQYDKFMENFGFYSERKPRKSNLLATKKISETFHTNNESDDLYFGFKKRSSKKTIQNYKKLIACETKLTQPISSKKPAKRGRKKKCCTKITSYCDVCTKDFRRQDNYLRHQMTLLHVSKLSEVKLKVKTAPVHEEPNYLIAYKQYLEKFKKLTDKLAKLKKKNPKAAAKIALPTLKEILSDVNRAVREQQLSQRGLSRDEALFLESCELLKESHNGEIATQSNLKSMSGLDILENKLDKSFSNEGESDGDVDSITAQTILDSEEVRNLENDLISGLKEAANASRKAANVDCQNAIEKGAVEPESGDIHDNFSTPNEVNTHCNEMKVVNENVREKPKSSKAKKHSCTTEFIQIKEKMYPDIIEDINMFEDKFDKIKRKCRSQAAAAKQTQHVVESSISHKTRRKSEKKKCRKSSKKTRHQSTQVPTKGALKGFDGIKVSIPTSDINLPSLLPIAKSSPKKKRRPSSKKRRDKKVSESKGKCNSDHRGKESSISHSKKLDVYEFKDNEDAELFEFRPSTLMERFKSISNRNMPSTSKFTPAAEENSSESGSDGDDFVYMSDDYVCSDNETENSLLSCDNGNVKVGHEIKKNVSPQKRKDILEKNAVMGKIFKHNALRTEKKITLPKETTKPKANLDQLFDSLLEDEPSTSKLNNKQDLPIPAEVSPLKKDTLTSKYDSTSNKDLDQISDGVKDKSLQTSRSHTSDKSKNISEFSSKRKRSSSSSKEYSNALQKHDSLLNKCDILEIDQEPSTSKKRDCYTTSPFIDYGPSTSTKYENILSKDYKVVSPNNHDQIPSKLNEEMKFNHSDMERPNLTDQSSVNTDENFGTYDDSKSPTRKQDEGIGTSYDYRTDAYDQSVFDEAGLARQRARRKCTVGKQNVLAETWSSESEPDGGPPRPNSAESDIAGRKKKGKKKDGQQSGGRRANNRQVTFKKQEIESMVNINNRNTSSIVSEGDSSVVYDDPGEGTSAGPSGVSKGAAAADAAAAAAAAAADAAAASAAMPAPSTSQAPPAAGQKGRTRSVAYYWSSEGDDEHEHQQQHGWIVGDSHKKLVTMLAHAKGRKRNNDDKRHLVE